MAVTTGQYWLPLLFLTGYSYSPVTFVGCSNFFTWFASILWEPGLHHHYQHSHHVHHQHLNLLQNFSDNKREETKQQIYQYCDAMFWRDLPPCPVSVPEMSELLPSKCCCNSWKNQHGLTNPKVVKIHITDRSLSFSGMVMTGMPLGDWNSVNSLSMSCFLK